MRRTRKSSGLAVSIRQNEKVVIGTTTMGDKALIVVVTATVVAK
jgi:hypothetical protein